MWPSLMDARYFRARCRGSPSLRYDSTSTADRSGSFASISFCRVFHSQDFFFRLLRGSRFFHRTNIRQTLPGRQLCGGRLAGGGVSIEYSEAEGSGDRGSFLHSAPEFRRVLGSRFDGIIPRESPAFARMYVLPSKTMGNSRSIKTIYRRAFRFLALKMGHSE